MAESKVGAKQTSYAQWAWDLVMGPTPVSPEEKMAEIEKRMEKLKSKTETDCDIMADDLKRLRRDMNKAAAKNDESEVRQLAKGYLLLEKQHKGALRRLEKVVHRTATMQDLRVDGLVNKDMLEYVQCQNRLMAPVANPRAVAATMAQFTQQKEATKLSTEMMDEALAEDTDEEEEREEEANRALEALVSETMSSSLLNTMQKLPTLNNVRPSQETNPAVTANKIQEFLQKKWVSEWL